MECKSIRDISLAKKNVLVRLDLNVPIKDGKITSVARIEAALPTIKFVVDNGGKLLICSHLGRPEAGKFDAKFSLAPIAKYLEQKLSIPVKLVRDYLALNKKIEVVEGIVLLENVRFNEGETENNQELGKKYAALCDIFIMDAFGTAHRSHASTYGVAHFASEVAAGFLMEAELNALKKSIGNAQRPLLAIVGGAKVSSKLKLLENIIDKVDILVLGGGIANTFIKACGYQVGKSLFEPELVSVAKQIIENMKLSNKTLALPTDLVCSNELSANAKANLRDINSVGEEDMILDFGEKSAKKIAELVHKAGTILWNGPLGVFEFEQFAGATKILAEAISTATAYSIGGGGDTIAAIQKFNISSKISYISTGGGAFLQFLEGKELPALEILKARAVD